jgi:hypothetical protein
MTITGIAPNSFQYNRFANFVRMSHHYASKGEQKERLVRFQLSNGEGRTFPYNGKRPNGRQITKGIHKSWDVAGQIQGAKAGGRKENHAPEFQFVFMIYEIRNGPWRDQTTKLETVASWMSIFKGLKKKDGMFVQPFEETNQNAPAKKPKKVSVKYEAFGVPGLRPSPFDTYDGPFDAYDPNGGPWSPDDE